MKDCMNRKFLTTLILILPFQLLADIGSLDSEQGNIYPVKNTSVSMSREYVYIKLFQDSVTVDATFWMYNKDSTQHGIVGFPDFSKLSYKLKEITDFRVSIDSSNVIPDTMFIEKDFLRFKKEFKWYAWEVVFHAKDTTLIQVSYTGFWGSAGLDPFKWFGYFLGTAKTWNGPIGEGTIVFDYTNYFSNRYISKCRWQKVSTDPDSLMGFLPVEDDRDMEVTTEENTQTYQFKNYSPRENESVIIEFLNPYDYHWYWYLWDDRYLEDYFNCHLYTKNDVYFILAELYARRGFIFNSPRETDYFEKRIWYKPNENFTPDKFSKGEKVFIEMLKIVGQNMTLSK